MTAQDVSLAKMISAIALDAGLVTESEYVSNLELALDTPDQPAVSPFWKAVLAAEDLPAHGPDDEFRDAHGAVPPIWFQRSGSEEPRQRWHLDVLVDPAAVHPRIEAAVAAGGTLVSDAEAPAFWVLADPDGNRMCLCTWQGRD